MWKPSKLILTCLLSLVFLYPSDANVGTASHYGPPYLPTACHGNDTSQFPADNLFAAAGAGIWDHGASCGRQYLVRCLSSVTPRACMVDSTVQVVIVDQAATLNSRPSQNGTTMVLSIAAFQQIANPKADAINIEFQQI